MTVIATIKRALGFVSDSDGDPDDDIRDTMVMDIRPAANTGSGRSDTDTAADSPGLTAPAEQIPDIDGMLPGRIFDSVIRLFNRTMPEFVRQCIDTDSQRQYLYHAIESDVRQQIIRVAEAARRSGAARTDESADASAAVPGDETRRELRRLRATHARQVSALEARVADLEAMIQQANDQNAALEEEIKTLKRRLRRSKTKPGEDDGQPSLFNNF